MRRLFLLVGLALVFALPAPVAAHTPAKPCSVSVDPGRGRPRDVYRITGRHLPHETNGGSLEVQLAISRVVFGEHGPRLKLQQILIAFLIPRSKSGKTSNRPNRNIRNIWAVHTPMPFTCTR